VAEKLADNFYNANLSAMGMQDLLIKNGVTEDKKVLSIPDLSTNTTLYLLKRKGFTEFNGREKILKERKAGYLVAGNPYIVTQLHLESYISDTLGSFHDIYLYRLK
jgi:hypothetical protein